MPAADGEAAVGTGRGVFTAGRLACGVACPVAGTGRAAGSAGADEQADAHPRALG